MSNPTGIYSYPPQGSGGGGLANTFTFLTCANEVPNGLPNAFQLLAGTGVAFTYGANSIVISQSASGGGGTAGNASKYILQQPDGTLPNSQALSSLSTGLLKSTTGTGVVSIGVAGTDFYPPGTAMPSGGGTGNTSTPAAGQTLIGTSGGVYIPAYLTPTTGIQITNSSGSITIGASAALGGTVTSVSAGNLSPLFTGSVSTPTSTPSITFTLVAQNSALAYMSPAQGAAGNPSFRSIQGSDVFSALSAGSQVTLTNNVSSVLISLTGVGSSNAAGTVTSVSDSGLPGLFTASVTNPSTTPSISYSFTTQSSSTFLAGPSSGSAQTPTFRGIVGNDLISTLIPGSNVTIAASGNGLVISSSGGGGGGVSSVSVGNFSPLFTASTSTPTTIPSTTFTAVNQASGLGYFSPATGAPGAPSFRYLQGTDILSALTAGANTTLTVTGSTVTISSTASGGGGGTVTSVSDSGLPGLFTASVGTPTTTPAISYTLVNQISGQVYASPNTTTGTPYFRNLIGTDIAPALVAGTNVSFSQGASALTISAVGSGNVGTFSSGNLSPLFATSVANPATAPALSFTLNNQASATAFLGPVSGAAGAPSFRSIALTDLPVGTGTVTSFSAGNASPLFTTSVGTSTTTPALSFTISSAASGSFYAGPTSGGSATPTFRALALTDLPLMTSGNIIVGSAAQIPTSVTMGGDVTIVAAGTTTIGANVVSNAKFRQGVAMSVVGVTGNATANVADIQSSAGNQVLASTSTTSISFRALAAADLPATTVNSVGNATPYFTAAISAQALSFTVTTQASGTVAAGPSSGANATPTFRAITGNDINSAILAGSNVTTSIVGNQLQINSTGGSSSYSTTVQSASSVTLTTSSTYLQELNALTGSIIVNLFATSGNFKEFLFARPDNSSFTVTLSANGADLIYNPNGTLSSTFVMLGSSISSGSQIPCQGSTARLTSNGGGRWYTS